MRTRSPQRPVGEAELHALTDRLLPEGERAGVEAWLEARPPEKARIERWRAQNTLLRATFAGVANEPLPLRLTMGRVEWPTPETVRPSWNAQRAAFAVGFLLGIACTGLVVLGMRLLN